MFSNSAKGPKNPFNKPLCNFQKTRQKTPMELQRKADVALVQQQKQSQQVQTKNPQGQVDDIQIHFGQQQKSPSDSLEATAFFSPQYQQTSERLLFRNETKELNNSKLQLQGQQSYLLNYKMQESMQFESLSPQMNQNKNLQSPKTQTHSKIGSQFAQFTCSNIIDTEYIQPENNTSIQGERQQIQSNGNVVWNNDKFNTNQQDQTADSQILERSLSYRKQMNSNNLNLTNYHQQQQQQQSLFQSGSANANIKNLANLNYINNLNNNQNIHPNHINSSSSASMASDAHPYMYSFGGNARDESEQHNNPNVESNYLINLNDSNDEDFIIDEKGLKNTCQIEKNKYPNESIFSKNCEYFLDEETLNSNIKCQNPSVQQPPVKNREEEEEEEDEEYGLGQEFISRTLDQKVKMIDRRISSASRQYTNSFDQKQNNNINLHDYMSEGGGENPHNKHLDNVINENAFFQKAQTLHTYNILGSNNQRNSRSTNTFSPKVLQQMSSQGMFPYNSFQSLGQQAGNEGINSLQYGFNSPSLASTQQAQSFYPLTRNLSTNSFKTSILKKDKNTFERTDSNRTQVDPLNQDLGTKKSRNVQFNQYSYVLQYNEDDKEKTDYPYDDQMFFSDDLEDDSMSLHQSIGTGSYRNQLRNPKITVLEKVSEKDRENKINSSLINSNIIKDSEIISSQSSNLIVTKKRQQQVGSLSSAIINQAISSSNQDDQNGLQTNIQDLVQIPQDSIMLSQSYIPQFRQFNRDDANTIQISPRIKGDQKSNGDQLTQLNFRQLGLGGNLTQTSLKSDNNLDSSKNDYPKSPPPYKMTQKKDNNDLLNTKLETIQLVPFKKNRDISEEKKYSSSKSDKVHSAGASAKSSKKEIEHSKSTSNLKQANSMAKQQQQRSESDLKSNSVQSNLELIMAKIQITQSSHQSKQILKKKKMKTTSTSCNIFQLICN